MQAPNPEKVRPLYILRQTLTLLKRKWQQEGDYTYICDQFKSLRQDLTVRQLTSCHRDGQRPTSSHE